MKTLHQKWSILWIENPLYNSKNANVLSLFLLLPQLPSRPGPVALGIQQRMEFKAATIEQMPEAKKKVIHVCFGVVVLLLHTYTRVVILG